MLWWRLKRVSWPRSARRPPVPWLDGWALVRPVAQRILRFGGRQFGGPKSYLLRFLWRGLASPTEADSDRPRSLFGRVV